VSQQGVGSTRDNIAKVPVTVGYPVHVMDVVDEKRLQNKILVGSLSWLWGDVVADIVQDSIELVLVWFFGVVVVLLDYVGEHIETVEVVQVSLTWMKTGIVLQNSLGSGLTQSKGLLKAKLSDEL
jgi:hypothetical protein